MTANLVASFEAGGQYVCDLVIHGTEGVLSLPDPNAFEGRCAGASGGGRGAWQDVSFASRGRGRRARHRAARPGRRRSRRTGRIGRPGELGLHVVEVARGILQSAAESRFVDIESRLDQPAPLPVAEAV